MGEADQTPKTELNEVLLAMDVVDTLRHQQSLIDRELGADDHDRALIEKVRDIYAGQGLGVSDDIIVEGVKALREERFTYRSPQKCLQLTLARLYVHRRRWTKRGGVVIAALLAIYLGYQVAVVIPQNRARKQEEQALQELSAMPAKLARQRDLVLAEAKEDAARTQAEALYNDAIAGVSRKDVQAVNKGYATLNELYDELVLEYRLRIVSRQDTPTGIWRIPENNPTARNYYIIVEAVTADNQRLSLPITSEEDGKTNTVEQWGLRVNQAVFEQIRRDKMDDGMINRNIFGVKKRGFLTVRYDMPTTGGAITRW
jgi:cell division protein FtsB